MRRLARVLHQRLRSVFRGNQADRDLGCELEIHIEQLENQYRASGMSERDAAAAARRDFGSIAATAETCRDHRRIRFLENTSKDLRYALRLLAKSPGFSLLAVGTLALGIGSVTMMFSVIYNVLLNPFPYTDPRRMVDVVIQNTTNNSIRGGLSNPEFRTFVDESRVFEDAVGTYTSGMLYRSSEGVEQFTVAALTPNSFQFLGVPPLHGRAIQEGDAVAGAPFVGVLSYKAWITYFGGDPAILNRTIVLDKRPMTVVGIMPPRFTWNVADMWIPDAVDRQDPEGMNKEFWLQARLKRGITLEQARSELNIIAARLAGLYPNRYPKQFKIAVIPVIDWVVGRFRSVLYTLFGAVALVLLIACCNVANMLLARGTAREREIAIRSALGASRFQIVRQMLVESMLLAVSGGVLGVILAYAGLSVLRQFIPPYTIPVETEIFIVADVLVFSVLVAILTALLFGVAPALQSTGRDVAKGLAGPTKGGDGGSGRGTLRNVLVVCEVTLSLVLLSGAAVLMQRFLSLMNQDLGFDAHNMLRTRTNIPTATGAERRLFLDSALQKLTSLPGVTAAGITSGFPPYGGNGTSIEVPGQDRSEPANAQFELCNDTYFELMGFRLLTGSPIERADVAAGRKIAVVNETLARKYFGTNNPLGRQIRITRLATGREAIVDPTFVIVGVMRDTRNRGLEEPVQPAAFIPYTAAADVFAQVLLRTSTDPRLFNSSIRQAVRAVNGNVVQRDSIILEDALTDRSYARPRFSVLLMAVFGAIGLILVGTGVYGIMAYVVSRQTQEIGIRMALGARQGQVFRSVFSNAFRLIGIGVLLGAPASIAMNRIIANQVWTVRMFDPIGFALAVVLIALLGGVACLRPALRATRVDPVLALRES